MSFPADPVGICARVWRRHVVEEAATLIPGDDQHALVPTRRIPDRLVRTSISASPRSTLFAGCCELLTNGRPSCWRSCLHPELYECRGRVVIRLAEGRRRNSRSDRRRHRDRCPKAGRPAGSRRRRKSGTGPSPAAAHRRCCRASKETPSSASPAYMPREDRLIVAVRRRVVEHADVAARTNIRFGSVGPGIELNH